MSKVSTTPNDGDNGDNGDEDDDQIGNSADFSKLSPEDQKKVQEALGAWQEEWLDDYIQKYTDNLRGELQKDGAEEAAAQDPQANHPVLGKHGHRPKGGV
jgi:hypothetical protein